MRLPPHVESGNWSLHRAIVEQAQDAIIYADRDGVIHLWNRGAEMIFGYAAAEVLGRNIDIIVPEKFSRVHAEGFRKALLSGATKYEGRVLTTRSRHKYGSRLYVDLSFGLLKDQTGAVTGAFVIGRDCTSRHLEEAALRLRAESHTG